MKKLKLVLFLLACCQQGMALEEANDDASAVLAQWNDVTLTAADLHRHIIAMSAREKGAYMNNKDKLTQALITMFKRKKLSAVAEAEGLTDSKTYQYKLQNAHDSILIELLQQRYKDDLPAVDYAALAYEDYLSNKENFSVPGQRRVSHILLRQSEGEDRAAEIADIRQRVLAQELTFSEAASEYSDDDVSARQQGSLGPIQRGKTVPGFDQVAFSLAEGEISQPVKTRFGWHLIKVDEIMPARQREFDEIKDDLMARAERDYKQSKWLEYVNEVTVDDAAPEVNEELLRDLMTEYTQVLVSDTTNADKQDVE